MITQVGWSLTLSGSALANYIRGEEILIKIGNRGVAQHMAVVVVERSPTMRVHGQGYCITLPLNNLDHDRWTVADWMQD